MWLDNIARSKSKQYQQIEALITSSRLACQVCVTEDFSGTTIFVCCYF